MAVIPDCIELEANNACSLDALEAVVSDDGEAIRIDISDKRGQLFPISMSKQDLCELLLLIGIMSQHMAEQKRLKTGKEPDTTVLQGKNGQDLPPLRCGITWSPETQKMRFIVGYAGLEFPMDADSALTIGQSLVEKAAPHATGRDQTSH